MCNFYTLFRSKTAFLLKFTHKIIENFSIKTAVLKYFFKVNITRNKSLENYLLYKIWIYYFLV